jgi:hypothetical protein
VKISHVFKSITWNLHRRNEQLRAEVARLKAAEFSRQAEALADGLIAAKKALPAEKPALVAAFAQAAQDDAANPAVVTFAEGKTGSRVEALKAVYEARPAHQLTEEMLKTGEGAALFNKGETDKGGKPMTAERKRELMGMSSLGKACLKEK